VTLLLLLALSLVATSGVLVLRTLTFGSRQRRQTLAQIDAYGFRVPEVDPAGSPSLRVMLSGVASWLGRQLLRHRGEQSERQLRSMLDSAGFYRMDSATFLGYRALAAIVFPLLIILLSASDGFEMRSLAAAGALAGFGWVLPKFVVGRRATHRLALVDREVPELVDLLVTAVEAGVGFAAALQLAARRIQGPLGEELRVTFSEQNMGLTAPESLKNLGTRVPSPAVRAFVQALIQGEALGVSTGKVLRNLAVDMRKRRRQAAEERAQKAPTKILFPLVGLILPAMFIVSLGPVVVTILRTLGE
jgi:tight adherence protein C